MLRRYDVQKSFIWGQPGRHWLSMRSTYSLSTLKMINIKPDSIIWNCMVFSPMKHLTSRVQPSVKPTCNHKRKNVSKKILLHLMLALSECCFWKCPHYWVVIFRVDTLLPDCIVAKALVIILFFKVILNNTISVELCFVEFCRQVLMRNIPSIMLMLHAICFCCNLIISIILKAVYSCVYPSFLKLVKNPQQYFLWKVSLKQFLTNTVH